MVTDAFHIYCWRKRAHKGFSFKGLIGAYKGLYGFDDLHQNLHTCTSDLHQNLHLKIKALFLFGSWRTGSKSKKIY